MGQKIQLSSNIPINLPKKLSENNFGLGFLYPCNSGKGYDLKEGETWFEKVCLSLNKFNAIVGFQTSNLKIPEYIAETVAKVEEQIEQSSLSLLVRYNAETKVNHVMNFFAPKENKTSFNDKLAKSTTKGTPMVILGENRLKKMFSQFEQTYGLESKIKFIINHEIAHNLDCARGYKRGQYSIKDIMESHIGARLDHKTITPFSSPLELEKTQKMINQIWTLSMEQYADVSGFLNLRNQSLEEGNTNKSICQMLDGLIYERKNNFGEMVTSFFYKLNNPENGLLVFEDRYKCINHFTVDALVELKNQVSKLGDEKLTIEQMEQMTIDIVNKSDLKAIYIIDKLDTMTENLMNKIFSTKTNEKNIIINCESRKKEFEEEVKKQVGEDWVKSVDKYILNNKDKKELYSNIEQLFGKNSEEIDKINRQEMNEKIQKLRSVTISYDGDMKRKLS